MATDKPDTPESRLAEQRDRVQEALRTGDVSSLRSSRDLGAYAWELSRLGRWDEAESAARRIEDDPEERGEALAFLAQGLAKRGACEHAIALVDQIPDDGDAPNAVAEKAIALVVIGKGIAAAGNWEEADKFFERAFVSLEALGDSRSPWVDLKYYPREAIEIMPMHREAGGHIGDPAEAVRLDFPVTQESFWQTLNDAFDEC